MSLETLVSLCSVLNISIDYLLLDEIPETDSEITALLSEVKSKGDIQYRKFVNIMKALTLVADKTLEIYSTNVPNLKSIIKQISL